MTNDISFMPRDATELEKMSLAKLIIHLATKGYKINFRKLENDNDDYRVLVIELQKVFLGTCYSKKTFIDPEICNMATLSYEYILKSTIIHMLPEFDKYNEIKKKVTT